jgi:hypothetical protein
LLKPSFRSLLRNWWPVVVWLGVIRVESTDMASAANTSGLLYTVISAVAPHIDSAFVDRLDEVLRKTGHFVGYGILSALVVLALQRTNRDRLRDLLKRPWGIYLRGLRRNPSELHTFAHLPLAGRRARHLRRDGGSASHLLAGEAQTQAWRPTFEAVR